MTELEAKRQALEAAKAMHEQALAEVIASAKAVDAAAKDHSVAVSVEISTCCAELRALAASDPECVRAAVGELASELSARKPRSDKGSKRTVQPHQVGA